MGQLLFVLVLCTGLNHRLFAGQVGTLSVSVYEFVAWLALGAALLALATASRAARSATAARFRAGDWAVKAYITWVIFAALLNAASGESLGSMHALKDMTAGLVTYAYLAVFVTGSRSRTLAGRALVVVITIVSAIAILQYMFGWPYVNAIDQHSYFKHAFVGVDIVRNPVVGTLGHPNAFALYLAPMSLLLLGLTMSTPGTSTWRLLPPISALALAGVALFLAQAKMAAAMWLVGVGTLFLSRITTRTYRPWMGWLAFAVVLSVGVASVWALLLFSWALPEGLAPGTVLERGVLNAIAWDVLANSPRFLLAGGGREEFRDSVGVELGVHNEYLNQMLLYGTPAAILLVFMLGTLLSRKGRQGWALAVPAICVLSLFLVEPASGDQLQGMLFTVLGLSSRGEITGETCHGARL